MKITLFRYLSVLVLFATVITLTTSSAAAIVTRGMLELVSVSSAGTQGNDDSFGSAISADGRYVAFVSWASNLVSEDNNEQADIFVHDRVSAQTTLISVSPEATQWTRGSFSPSLSADGRFVAFESGASNPVRGDDTVQTDIFVHDRLTGQTSLISVSSEDVQGNDSSSNPSISADGHYVAFVSQASNLVSGDDNEHMDAFVHDRETGETTRVSVSSNDTQADGDISGSAISGDGRYVEFTSVATNLVDGDSNSDRDVFVHDRVTGETTRVSVSSAGTQGNGDSFGDDISTDGRYVTFSSRASNLVSEDKNNEDGDIFVHDRVSGETTLISVSSEGIQGQIESLHSQISADGRYVAFGSRASNLVSGDTAECFDWEFGDINCADVFVHDRVSGQTTLISVSPEGTQGNEPAYGSAISADGCFVTFISGSTTLLQKDTSNRDVFVHVRCGNIFLPFVGRN